MRFPKIALAYNLHREDSIRLADRAEAILSELGREIVRLPLGALEPHSQRSLEKYEGCELAVILGGDGSLLSAARTLADGKQRYLLGINAGNLGFLSDAGDHEDLRAFFEIVLAGEFQVDERTMLSGELVRGESDDKRDHLLALNDIVIARSSRSHILKINLDVDDSEIAQYSADGLILCTPTGSTAYALAAGGAVLAPDIGAFEVVPICAHSLTSRPLVISDRSTLRIRINPRTRRQSLITVQADGQDIYLLEPEDHVYVRRSPRTTKLIRSLDPRNNFYRVLSHKLLWGRSG